MGQFQNETRTSIQNLENQIGQLVTSMSKLETQVSNKLHSQTIINPRENASAIVLRSGKELDAPRGAAKHAIRDKRGRERVGTHPPTMISPSSPSKDVDIPMVTSKPSSSSEYKPLPPFPSKLARSKKEEANEEIFETFSESGSEHSTFGCNQASAQVC